METQVYSLGLVPQFRLTTGEPLGVARAGRAWGRSFQSLASLAALLSAAGGPAGRLPVVVLDLSGHVRVGRKPAGRFAAPFADRLVADEFSARFTLPPFAGPAADLAGVGQAVAGHSLGAHVRDRTIHRVPAGSLVERIGRTARYVVHLVEKVFLLFHQFADEVFQFAGQLGHRGLLVRVGERFFLTPLIAVGAVG